LRKISYSSRKIGNESKISMIFYKKRGYRLSTTNKIGGISESCKLNYLSI